MAFFPRDIMAEQYEYEILTEQKEQEKQQEKERLETANKFDNVAIALPWPARVYLAGRIRDDDWRTKVVPIIDTYKDKDFDQCNNNTKSDSDEWPETSIDHGLIVVGPRFVDCYKCCHAGIVGPHGSNLDFDRRSVSDKSMSTIRRADFVFAWLEPEAYGTVA